MARTLVWLAGGAGFLVLAGVVGLALAASSQPSTLHVERSRLMNAAPEDVIPLASDMKQFVTWSPWADRDPNQVSTFSEPSGGVGAWYHWKGNGEVGEGKMTVTAMSDVHVDHEVAFLLPWESTARVSLRAQPEGEGTRTTWTFEQEADFTTKLACLFVDIDGMLGADFEKGLTRLADRAEEGAAARRVREQQAFEAANRLVEEEAARLAAPPVPAGDGTGDAGAKVE